MNRTPLLLSILAVVIAVVAMVVAIIVPGPQGPKGDTGPEGLQGIQGPPSLSVERQLLHLTAGANGGQGCTAADIDLDAGDVLHGYFASAEYYSDPSDPTLDRKHQFDYQVNITGDLGAFDPDSPDYPYFQLGSGEGGATFSFVAPIAGTYWLAVRYEDISTVVDYHPSGLEEYMTVVYWIQEAAEQGE